MSNKFVGAVVGVGFTLVVVLAVLGLLSWLFGWNIPSTSPDFLLNAVGGVVCFAGLLFVVKVPWDLYYEAKSLLFEMERSIELGIPVKPERRAYVVKLRRVTGVVAVASHILSAGLIAAVTYFSNGQTGYYFAVFYVLSMLFRPAGEAHKFLREKLREIRGEVKFPREDVVKLRADLDAALDRLKAVERHLIQVDDRFTTDEAHARKLETGIHDLGMALRAAEDSFQNRLSMLNIEFERALTKVFDQQDLVNGLRAFARLVKSA